MGVYKIMEQKRIMLTSKRLFVSFVLLANTFMFAQNGKELPPLPVKTYTVNNNIVKITKKYPATIKAKKSVDIITRVSGNLEKRYFEEGSFVRKGQKLYKIEQRTYQANVDSSKAALSRAKALLVKATSDWKRYKNLFAKKAISASIKDQYFYNYEDAKANVKNAKAVLTNAKIQYEYTQITAPMDGIISITNLNEGNFVNANTKLTTITKVDPVYVEFSLPQADIAQYLNHIKSEDVRFSINCQNKCISNGVLKYISPTLDSSTDTLLLRTEFENRNNQVIVGQFTNINIENIKIPGTLSIPEEAIMQNGTNSVVYIIDEKSTAQIKPVTLTGESSKGKVVISGGLKIDDRIIISNIAKIRPNSKVKIIKGNK